MNSERNRKRKEKNKDGKEIYAMAILFVLMIFIFRELLLGEKTFLWHGDAVMQTYSWLAKISHAIHNGEFALWDFNQYAGISFAGEIQTAPFYFGNLLFGLLVPNVTQHAIDVYLWIHSLAAAYFMYGFLRYNKQNRVGSIVGALIFSCIGSVAARVQEQPNIYCALVFLPIVIWTYQISIHEKSGRFKRILFQIISGAFLGNMILAGHMQPYLHAVIALGIFALCFSKSFKNCAINLARLFHVGVVSVATCFGQIVCGVEYIRLSYRWVGLEHPVKGFDKLPASAYDFVRLKWSDVEDFIRFTGNIGDGCTLYLSVTGVVLAIFGILGWIVFFKKEKFTFRRIGLYALVLTIVCIDIAFGKHSLLGRLVTVLPGFGSVREPARILYVYNFSAATLAAIGTATVVRFFIAIFRIKNKKIFRIVNAGFKVVFYTSILVLLTKTALDYNRNWYQNSDCEESAQTAYEENELIDYLVSSSREDMQNGYLYRFGAEDKMTITPNIGSVYGEMLGVYAHRATMPATYFDFLNKYAWDWNGKMGNLLSVKYYVSDSELDPEVFGNFDYVTTLNEKKVYVRNSANSIFTMINEDGSLTDVKAYNLKMKTNGISFDFEAADSGMLRMGMLDFPGWVVKVDGRRHDKANDEEGFIAVYVPKGHHTVSFAYRPWWLYVWGVILAAYLAFFVYCIMVVRKRNSNVKPPVAQ
ncbi:MAG: YfhO family protein [Lachnospiraceae bacterium]|nr:YfhO family protein [Lachnospiraceae bacterium]